MIEILKVEHNGKRYKVLEQAGSHVKTKSYYIFKVYPWVRWLSSWRNLDECKIISSRVKRERK